MTARDASADPDQRKPLHQLMYLLRQKESLLPWLIEHCPDGDPDAVFERLWNAETETWVLAWFSQWAFGTAGTSSGSPWAVQTPWAMLRFSNDTQAFRALVTRPTWEQLTT